MKLTSQDDKDWTGPLVSGEAPNAGDIIQVDDDRYRVVHRVFYRERQSCNLYVGEVVVVKIGEAT